MSEEIKEKGKRKSKSFFEEKMKCVDKILRWREKTLPACVRGSKVAPVQAMRLAINPLSFKSRVLREDFVEEAIRKQDIDLERPIILQVGNLGRNKRPGWSIDAYKLLKEQLAQREGIVLPQLVLLTNSKADWEKATILRNKIKKEHLENDVFILDLSDPNLEGYPQAIEGKELEYASMAKEDRNALVVNAFQTKAVAGIHPSKSEAFGLAVTELLWKGHPVVATSLAGIRMQYGNEKR